MTIHDLISHYSSGFENFFDKKINFKLRIELTSVQTPCIQGIGQEMKICIPEMYNEVELESLEKELAFLIVLSHEAAHYINNHNEHTDKDNIDSKAIEIWADFFGYKILITLCCFSVFFINRYKFKSDYSKFLLNYYNSVNVVFKAYYVLNPKYPSPFLRYQIAHTALTSMITKLQNGNPLDSKIIEATKIFSELSSNHKVTYSDSEQRELNQLSEMILKTHQQIIAGRNEITEGLKDIYKKFIGTHY